jgi:DNA processing protein
LINSELREKLTDAIALLNVPGIGRGRYNKLVQAFGSPAAVFEASVFEIQAVPGFAQETSSSIKTQYNREKASQIASRIVQLGWAVLFPDESEYPKQLLTISDYPPLLFRIGEPASHEDKIIAIVGTRHPTEKGKLFTFNLASALAQAGITVVSGMAEGIDSAAHKGALDAGGKTVAVWGNSLDHVYPSSNRGLAEKTKAQGAVYSEYFPDTRPDPAHFPERNRIISGLAEGVVVVEAGVKSGALITARLALEQGRELLAVPGFPNAPMSAGTNALIKNGAKLLTSADDLFEELPRLKSEMLVKKYKQLPDMTDVEKEIVSVFTSGPVQIDQISRSISLPVSELMEFLLALELKGVVREVSGKRFVLVEEYQ